MEVAIPTLGNRFLKNVKQLNQYKDVQIVMNSEKFIPD